MAKAKKAKDLDAKARAKKVKGGRLEDEPRRTNDLVNKTTKGVRTAVYRERDRLTRKGKGI